MLKALWHNFLLTFFILGLFLIGPFALANTPKSFSDISFNAKDVSQAIAPLQKLSEAELLAQVKETSKNSPMGRVFENFPLLAVFMVRLIQDKEAFPQLVKILENKIRLKNYGYWMIVTFIFGFFLKRLIRSNKNGHSQSLVIDALFNYIFRFAIMLCIRLAITYAFFSVELTPAFKVFSKTFL